MLSVYIFCIIIQHYGEIAKAYMHVWILRMTQYTDKSVCGLYELE